ncbi:hypothetical protein Loa_02069 [Legionella oakridgensis ATCC 33761 = DSM 21215]|uniref:Uncharacterized protein n=2 Tax=Legionella oakridgensis TaxID=29423 RepID=W0BAN9_9GAMM|nr:hypothetical protein [Legionella oakridgensis]AHE67613.1 hypothetical protein Loa_02069 [Legionella oakridgensis ATCC 33761 = DSM 21215]ETO92851.1 hypothetical protein LOR_61c15050 [Legionella oakridgensis RV-2-2007]KTD37042.1 hypothetical protein Loak_2178 [Legionella oakridgensis]STY20649.1 Uncharacterised protein [Legionella longbeachae]
MLFPLYTAISQEHENDTIVFYTDSAVNNLLAIVSVNGKKLVIIAQADIISQPAFPRRWPFLKRTKNAIFAYEVKQFRLIFKIAIPN